MKKIIFGIFFVIAAAAALSSCAKEDSLDSDEIFDRVLASWIKVNYSSATKTASGVYVISMDKGSGKAVGDSSYVFVHYTRTDLEGNVASTNYEELSKRIGIHTQTAYYGSDIWRVGQDAICPGVEEILKKMCAGGHAMIAVPVSQSKVTNSTYNAFSESESSNVIYEFEVEDVLDDINSYENKLMTEYSARYFNAMDSIAGGFYFKLMEALPDADTITDEGNVKVRYIGRLLNGTVFDTNIEDTAKKYRIYSESNEYNALDITFKSELEDMISDNSTVKGFTMAVHKLKKGEGGVTFFHSDLGYGAKGSSTSIPEYSPLRFDIWIEASKN